MKYTIKYVLTMVTLLLATTGAWADSTVTITKQLSGVTSDDAGTVTSSVTDGICTLTVTPTDGNYATVDNITAYATVTGEMAQSRGRAPGINEGTITVTATDSSADPSGETTYTFTMPTDGSNVEVTVDFQNRTNISAAEVTLAESSMTYTGNELKPAVTSVVLDGTISSDNYDVTYENNINATTETSLAIVTVTGKRTYTGSATATFVIAKATIAATAENVTATYDGQGYGITVNVTAPATGATITYGETSDAIDKTTSPTQTAVGEKTVYYKVTADNYETLTGSATVTISAASIANAVIADIPDRVFKNDTITPLLTVTLDGKTLVAYEDYGIYYTDNVNVGTATAHISGMGNYTGEASKEYKITPKTTALTIALSEEGATYSYDGTEKKPEVTVYSETTELTAAKDYSITYSDNVNAGKATITANGIGNYEGATGTLNFTISQAAGSISYKTTSVSKSYGDAAFTNELTIVGDGTASYASSDETVATVDANGEVTITGAGTATITATVVDGTNYKYATDANKATYTITVTKAAPTLTTAPTATNPTYTGEAIPLVSGGEVKNGTLQYVIGTDAETAPTEGFSATVPNATNVGTYYVWYKVVGNTNYVDTDPAMITSTISKAAGTISYNSTTISKKFGDEPFKNELTNNGDGTVSFSSDNSEVATIDASTGEVTLTGVGKATITATVTDGSNYTYEVKTATYELNVGTRSMSVTASGYTGVYDGESHTISVEVATPNEGATIKYGTAEGSYDLTAAPGYSDAGTYTVYFQVTADDYDSFTGNATVTISKADAAITKAPTANESLVYTGSEQTLIKAGEATGGTMNYSTDGETFSAELPTGTNAGDYTIYYKVAGDRNHNDVMAETTIQVNIASKELTSSMASLESESVIYNGSAQEPTVTVTDGETTLTAGTDYAVTYSDNTEIGTAKAIITGSGNYTGTVELTFTIIENVSGELTTAFGESHKYCTFVPRQELTIPDGVKAYAVTGIDLTSRTVTISEVNYLVAGVPLLLEKTGNEIGSSKLYDGEKSEVTTILKSSGENGKSVGSGESCYVLYNDEYVKVTSGTTIAANKYYIQQATNPAGAPRRLAIKGGTTAIDVIQKAFDETANDTYYDLNGRRVLYPIKGQLYIVNGKKVVYNK